GRSDFERATPEILPAYAWCYLNAWNRTHPVGTRLRNHLGLFDILGNAHEWCHDSKRPYCEGHCHLAIRDDEDRDPAGGRSNRVLRRSLFGDASRAVRTDAWSWNWPIYPSAENGFRVARTMPGGGR